MIRTLMLDTNMISHIVKQQESAFKNFVANSASEINISVISYGEISFGLEKRPEAVALNRLMREFLSQIDILPWTSSVAVVYGSLRSRLESRGISTGDLDLLIAAHAIHAGAILVTADKAFSRIDGLSTENWLL